MLAVAGLLVATASAAVGHPFLFRFGPNGTSATHFITPEAVAVDQGTHDVYAVDSKFAFEDESVVFRFTSTGAADKFTKGPGAGTNRITGFVLGAREVSGLAVAPPDAPGGTAGDLYVSSTAGVDIYSPEGEHLGNLGGAACDVATDPAGNVYVRANGIEKYVPSANPVVSSDFDSRLTGAPGCHIAAGTISLYTGGQHTATRYDLSLFPGGGGSADVSLDGTVFFTGNPFVRDVEVDPTDDGVYVPLDGLKVLQFDQAGNQVSFIGTPHETWGVAVDRTSGNVFVTDSEINGVGTPPPQVRVYGPGITVDPPTEAIDPVGTFTYHSAHFTGTVNSGGSGEFHGTTYRFECSPGCPGLQGPRPVPTDDNDHEVSDDSEGLQAETKYTVTLTATNEVGDETKDTTSFETPAKLIANPPAVTIDPVATFSDSSAQLSGTVDPGGLGENQATAYRFEYSTDDSKWSVLEDQGPIEGLGPQGVSTELEGLEPNTTYFVRLRAENVGGAALSEAPDPSFTTKAAAPLVEATAATHVLGESAQLNARIDPRNSATTYYFQWGSGDCESSPCTSVPASQDAEAGSGSGFVFANAQISGLTPGATYHYRVIAASAGGETTSSLVAFRTAPAPAPCPNEALRLGASAGLPDCRAYEMVSPLDKNGGDIATQPTRTRSSADGNAVTYKSTAGFADPVGSTAVGVEYLSSRGTEGWATHPITPYQAAPEFPSGFSGSNYVGEFSPDLDKGIFSALAPIPGAGSVNVDGTVNLYLGSGLREGSGSFQLLSDSTTPLGNVPQESAPYIKLGDASADFSHVIFETTDNLTPEATGEGPKLYEWVDGAVRLAGILPDSACGSPPCRALESVAGAAARTEPAFGGGTYTQLSHTISDDGSRVFFTAGALHNGGLGGDAGFTGHLYVREDGTQTVQIDAGERTPPDPNGPGRSEFQMATPDGEEVFFLSDEELTDADKDGSHVSLYRYDTAAPPGKHLTLIPTGAVTPSHVVGISEDGSYLYLLSTDRVLYVLHGGEMRKVALQGQGDPNWGEDGTFSQRNLYSNARVTPDGSHILFVSRENQIGYEPHNDACFEDKCNEVYLYSYDSDQLVCASCSPTGEPPTDDAGFLQTFDSGTRGDVAVSYLNSPLTQDGTRLLQHARSARAERLQRPPRRL